MYLLKLWLVHRTNVFIRGFNVVCCVCSVIIYRLIVQPIYGAPPPPQALSLQPVAFYFAVANLWFSYSSGIYTGSDCVGMSINHAM